MKEYKSTPIIIDTQGAPMLAQECAYIMKRGDDIVALHIDMKSKHCEVGASIYSSGDWVGITIDATEYSLYLDETKDKNEFTVIYFPEFKGWDIFATYCGRYNINVCLTKED